jgi:predicted DNA-binding transcriptional regulator AlpA
VPRTRESLVGSQEIEEATGLSRSSISRYCQKYGMPHVARGSGGWYSFYPSRVYAWIRAQRADPNSPIARRLASAKVPKLTKREARKAEKAEQPRLDLVGVFDQPLPAPGGHAPAPEWGSLPAATEPRKAQKAERPRLGLADVFDHFRDLAEMRARALQIVAIAGQQTYREILDTPGLTAEQRQRFRALGAHYKAVVAPYFEATGLTVPGEAVSFEPHNVTQSERAGHHDRT